jgi:hypothetical protein
MQADDQIGKVAAAVPVIVARSLESFAELLLKRINEVTTSRNAKTVTPNHVKCVIAGDARFRFLAKFVEGVSDVNGVDVDLENNPHHNPHNPAVAMAPPPPLVHVPPAYPVYSQDGSSCVPVSAPVHLVAGTNQQPQ